MAKRRATVIRPPIKAAEGLVYHAETSLDADFDKFVQTDASAMLETTKRETKRFGIVQWDPNHLETEAALVTPYKGAYESQHYPLEDRFEFKKKKLGRFYYHVFETAKTAVAEVVEPVRSGHSSKSSKTRDFGEPYDPAAVRVRPISESALEGYDEQRAEYLRKKYASS